MYNAAARIGCRLGRAFCLYINPNAGAGVAGKSICRSPLKLYIYCIRPHSSGTKDDQYILYIIIIINGQAAGAGAATILL